MGSATLTLRLSQLKKNINDHQLEDLKLSMRRQRLSSYSSMLSSGVTLSPSTIASVGTELFGTAIDQMDEAAMAAADTATAQVSVYENYFRKMTQDQYCTSGLASEAALYLNDDGSINSTVAYEKFYKEALKEYVEQYIKPELNELEKELDQQQLELQTLLKQEENEMQTVEGAIEKAVQSEAIKL